MYSPGIKSLVSKSEAWCRSDSYINFYDGIGPRGSLPCKSLSKVDLKLVKENLELIDNPEERYGLDFLRGIYEDKE